MRLACIFYEYIMQVEFLNGVIVEIQKKNVELRGAAAATNGHLVK